MIWDLKKKDHIHIKNFFNKELMYVKTFTTNVKNQNKTPQKHEL